MKHQIVTLFVLKDDAASTTARQLLVDSLPEGSFRVRVCPPFMAEDYTMPFLANVDKSPYYGLEGIKYFLEKKMAALSA